MLIYEAHFTNRRFAYIHKYILYDTKHPDNKAHGESAVTIYNNILYHEREKLSKDFLYVASVITEDELACISRISPLINHQYIVRPIITIQKSNMNNSFRL